MGEGQTEKQCTGTPDRTGWVWGQNPPERVNGGGLNPAGLAEDMSGPLKNNHYQDLANELDLWMRQMIFFGFKSQKFDLNLAKTYLIQRLMDSDYIEDILRV